jgi:hypothetical protein
VKVQIDEQDLSAPPPVDALGARLIDIFARIKFTYRLPSFNV